MALNEIKKQVVLMLQSVLSLNSSERTEALCFLKDCAASFGLQIPENVNNISFNSENDSNSAKEVLIPTEKYTKIEETTNSITKINEVDNLTEDSITENKTEKQIDLSNLLNESNFSDLKFLNEDAFEKNEQPVQEKIVEEESLVKVKKTRVKQSQTTSKNSSGRKIVNKSEKLMSKEGKDVDEEVKSSGTENKKSKRILRAVKDENQENKNALFKCPGCTVTCKNKTALLLHFTQHPKAPMSCRLCRSNFNNVLHFWRHQKKKECKISLFKCVECDEKFKYRRHYLKHVLGHNDNNCRYCDEKFSTWLLYKHHLKRNHPNVKMERDLIPCKFCAMSFRRHLGLYNHYQLEHSKGKFVCLSCGLLLPTKEKYKEHTLVHESEKSWKCKICKMKFYRRQQLLFHVSVHKSGTYKCLTCNITVTSKADLCKHKKDGHEVKGLEPKFKCEICHKNFKRKVVLKNHMATHSKEKEYYCRYCVKNFSTLDALQKHQKRKSHFEKAKIVLPESKYEKVYEDKLICESCGKQYKTQRELTWHLRVHKSIYECHECGKTFTLKVNLTKHIKLHRNKVCVVCELCGNTFNQLSALNEHNLMKHSDVRKVECAVCKKKFKRKSELNRHMRIHEQKRPFACFCGTAFNQSSHLQTHYKTFHEKSAEQNNLLQSGNQFMNSGTEEVFNDPMLDRRKPVYVNGEQGPLLPLGNIETEDNYRSTSSYNSIQINENHENKAPYLNNYNLRFPQTEIDPMNVAYEDLNFSAPEAEKRGLVFNGPAVDLSMVAISEVVQNDMNLGGTRDITETVDTYNKISEDASNIQLVNLSEHIVQEYLLNLP